PADKWEAGTRSGRALETGRQQTTRKLGRSLRNRCRRSGSLFCVAALGVRREDNSSRQTRVSATDVRQRRFDSTRLPARAIPERRTIAASVGSVAGRRTVVEHDLSRYLLSKFHGMVRAVRPQWQPAI